MSLKAELETWSAALKAYDEQDFEKALDLFSKISDSSKILTNMGLIYATLGEHEAAVEKFLDATSLDKYLAVAYFQCGVSNFLIGRCELALRDFQEALLYLRGNQAINYDQLGLKFKLFSAEVLFNLGLSRIYMGQVDEGLTDMEQARQEKATDEHSVIDDAIQDRGEGYTVFSIPVGVLYRPSENKIKNVKAKDYMGKAKLIAASDAGDAFTEFTGVTRLNNGISPSGVLIDARPIDSAPPLSRSATAPAPFRNFSDLDPPRASNLGRSKTAGAHGGKPAGSSASPLVRSNTTNSNAPLSLGGPSRGPTVRRNANGSPPSQNRHLSRGGSTRMTEFYDDYIDSYTEEPPMPGVANWSKASPGSRGVSSYSPSSFSGGSLRRKLSRRPTARSKIAPSVYEEEEEGYGSGEYEDGFALVKIRVKLHYQDDVRGMALVPEMPFEEFMDKLTAKFGLPVNGLRLKFKDEDGGMVSLRDESDYELAIETARESAKGRPEGKLEIWCTDA